MDKSETSTKRIPLTPTTFDRLREFVRGMDVNYDDAIDALLNLVENSDTDPLLAGRKFASDRRKKKIPEQPEPKKSPYIR